MPLSNTSCTIYDHVVGGRDPLPSTVLAQEPAATPTDLFAGVSKPRPFLIIAPDEFMAGAGPAGPHKNATGTPTLAVTIRQMTTQFPGVDDP